jgi:hypothetical protein
MQKSFLPPIRRGGKPAIYPQMIRDLKVGQYIKLKSPKEQIGCYKAALRMGKFAAIRTVDTDDLRVYIISKSEYKKLRGRWRTK